MYLEFFELDRIGDGQEVKVLSVLLGEFLLEGNEDTARSPARHRIHTGTEVVTFGFFEQTRVYSSAYNLFKSLAPQSLIHDNALT